MKGRGKSEKVSQARSILVAPATLPFSCLLLTSLLLLVHLSAARPICILVKTLPSQGGDHWDTKHNSVVLGVLGKRIGLEWEIWANVEDGYEEADSFWPWHIGSIAGNNSVRANGKYIHQWFAQIPREHSVKLTTDVEDGEGTTHLSALMSSSDFDRRYSLTLELTLLKPLEGDQEPPSWPLPGEQLGQWSLAHLRISTEEKLPERRIYNKFTASSRNIAVDNCL